MSGFLLPRPCLRRTGTTLAALLCLALAACGMGGPPPVTYVLGTPIVAAERVQPLAGRPVIEVKPVLVPDYLDVSDIMVRQAGNMVTPSPTGRWGERLSVGVTRALADGLAARLPGFVVTTTAPESSMACARLNGTSPVPGGRSTMSTSSGGHATPRANCLTALATIGPRQIAGERAPRKNPKLTSGNPCASMGTM